MRPKNLPLLLLYALLLLTSCPGTFAQFGFKIDGNTEIVWHHNILLSNAVWFMYETNYFNTNGTFPKANSANWQMVATTDFDRDGRTDFLWRNGTTGENAIWLTDVSSLNEASTIKAYQFITSGDLDYDIVGAGDFNGDGYADILWRHKALDRTVAWFMNGTNFRWDPLESTCRHASLSIL